MDDERTFQRFMREVEQLLNGTAKQKAYNQTGPDSTNRLYEFVEDMNGGPGHALGEVVYKMKRYAAMKNAEDVCKAAAWCFLMWKHHQ